MSDLELRVCWLYPEYMGIYADRGNIEFIRRRCRWRGIGFQLTAATLGDSVEAADYDLFYIGGGQDRDQVTVAQDLVELKRGALADSVESSKVVLAVCGGYQLLGNSYQLGDQVLKGAGLVDLKTVRRPGPRLIGNVAIETDLNGRKVEIVGFENHGGLTYLGSGSEPFGRVVKGHGNNGSDKSEGVRLKNLIGTYLHGPLLPKNHIFADHLTVAALSTRYGQEIKLNDLDDTLELAAHENAKTAVRN